MERREDSGGVFGSFDGKDLENGYVLRLDVVGFIGFILFILNVCKIYFNCIII